MQKISGPRCKLYLEGRGSDGLGPSRESICCAKGHSASTSRDSHLSHQPPLDAVRSLVNPGAVLTRNDDLMDWQPRRHDLAPVRQVVLHGPLVSSVGVGRDARGDVPPG